MTGAEYRFYSGVYGSYRGDAGSMGTFAYGTDTTMAITFTEFVPLQVPEPATLALLGLGLGLVAALRRRVRCRRHA